MSDICDSGSAKMLLAVASVVAVLQFWTLWLFHVTLLLQRYRAAAQKMTFKGYTHTYV